MKQEDFTVTADVNGYMIYYKGKGIGGAGIKGESYQRGKAAVEQIKSYRESAKYDIDSILNGNGQKHMLDAIKEIDQSNP